MIYYNANPLTTIHRLDGVINRKRQSKYMAKSWICHSLKLTSLPMKIIFQS